MAKSSRASSRKTNNRRLASNVFAPAEDARRERLSAKLLELAKQPKPDSLGVNMDLIVDDVAKEEKEDQTTKDDAAMEVDSAAKPSERITKKRIDKRRQKKSSIVFAKYGDRMAAKKNRGGK